MILRAGKYYEMALKFLFLVDIASVVAKFEPESRTLKIDAKRLEVKICMELL